MYEGIVFLKQLVEAEIAAFNQMSIDGSPLGKDDGLSVGGLHRECITAEDIMEEDVAHRLAGVIVGIFGAVTRVLPIENIEHPLPTFFGIILQELYTVDAGDSDNGIAFIIERVFAVATFDDIEFTTQNFGQKITVATGWLEKTAVNTFGFVFYQIEHGIDLALVCENFTVVGNALLRFGLRFIHLESLLPYPDHRFFHLRK